VVRDGEVIEHDDGANVATRRRVEKVVLVGTTKGES